MKIYLGHTKQFDFKNELYLPLRQSQLNQEHEIVLPHENGDQIFDSKTFLNNCDLMIAEVSYPSISLGIEMGWANGFGCRIICVYKKGAKISDSLKTVCDNFIEYNNSNDLIKELIEELNKLHV